MRVRLVTTSLITLAVSAALAGTQAPALWVEAPGLLAETATWTNKVEVADLNGDGRPDLLFANGGDYSTPGKPEGNGAFINTGDRQPFEDRSVAVFGATPDHARRSGRGRDILRHPCGELHRALLRLGDR